MLGKTRDFTLLTALACLPWMGCAGEPSGPWRGPGTIQMAERLRLLADSPNPDNRLGHSARADSLRAVAPPAELAARLQFEARLATEILHAGDHGQAAARFQALFQELRTYGERVPLSFTLSVLESLGIAKLKLWEGSNCVATARSELCLMPLEMDGDPANQALVPGSEEAARSAAQAYEVLTRMQPDNLNLRWLLNLAYMRLGQYPAGVPAAWLIPPEAFRSEYDLDRFPEIGARLGLDVKGHAGGSIMDDFDGDGDLDIVASSWHLTDQLRFFVNNGDGTFSDRTVEAGLGGLVGGLNMVHADYNNDGYLDVFVLRGAWLPAGQPNSLLRNNGDGTFEDVTEQAGLLETHPTQTAAWGDYDNDGWVDLYVGNESLGDRRIPNRLFRNNGDGTFTDVAAAADAAAVGFVKAVVWGDVDNDGRLDLFISRMHQPNLLLRNAGPDAAGRWRFSDATAEAGVAAPIASFPAWFWDYDNDGWLDIFVSGYRATPGDVSAEYLGLSHSAEPPRLYRNNGDGHFSDVTAETRLDRIMLTMGSNYGDLDSDGFQDFYVGTGDPDFRQMIPNRMFRNAGGKFFQEVTTVGGFGHLGKGHGVAFGDLDNDGDQDIYATLGGALEGDLARNVTFENPGSRNRWITLRLEGVRSNRAAIGARIEVSVETPSGPRAIRRTVSSGGSFGANSLQQEIGLGQAREIESIKITWPATGSIEVFTAVEMNRIYRVREGDRSLTPVRIKP